MSANADGKKKKQTIILGALGLVLAVVLGSQLMGGKPQRAAQAKQTGAKQPARNAAENLPDAAPTVGSVFQRADVDLDTLVQEIKVVEFEYNKEIQERDPTIPLAGDAMRLRAKTMVASERRTPEDIVQAAKMKHVTGIIWGGATPYAVIDNNVVSKGYTFDEAIFVKAIEKDHVVLGIEGQDTEVVAELKEQ
jgi:hypothetical protein